MPKFRMLCKSLLIGSSPWLLAAIFLGWLVLQTKESIDRAAYAYPREVVAYGLVEAKTDEDVLNTIQIWKHDAWGAQIGALRVLCKNDRYFVNSLGGGDTGAKICRVAR